MMAKAADKTPHHAVTGPEVLPRGPWRLSLAIYLRVVSLALLGYGIYHWGYVLGAVDLPPAPFLDLRPPVRNAVAVLAAANLVAAIGLWFAANWGIAFGLITTAASIMLHTAFAEVHGARPLVTAIQIVAVVAIAVLWFMARREERIEDETSRSRRRQSQTTT